MEFINYSPIVSKSLLIVLGTLPLPAKNGRGKSIHHLCKSKRNCPPGCSILLFCISAGSAGGERTSRLFAPEMFILDRYLKTNLFRFFVNFTIARFALVKAHDYLILPACVIRQKRYLTLPAKLVSLDNSFPLHSQK